MKATGLKLGILANFGHYPGIEIERIVAETGCYATRPRARLPESRRM
jgi:hypothetical protein